MARDIAPTLGVRWHGDHSTATVATAHSATRVELCRFDTAGIETREPLDNRLGVMWWTETDLAPGDHYGFRVSGPGHDQHRLLVDPYALAIEGSVDWAAGGAFLALNSGHDSAPFVPRSVVVDPSFAWGADTRPGRPWGDTVIYEVHVKGATMCHPHVPASLRGTYAGFAHPAFVNHLVQLGVTAVQLLPVHHSVAEERLEKLGLTNYWGYNTLGFFAPHGAYAADGVGGAQVREFKAMVKELHTAGLEVILDVVYNHTAEAGPYGPTLAWRGFDPHGWYREHDVTGCGNTLDLRQPLALRLVLDSLRYWVTEMHVDGFRFDLATALCRGRDGSFERTGAFLAAIAQDPVLNQVKLIAEPWDVGPGGYQLGAFPAPWAAHNDRFRDVVRDHWRDAPGALGALAARVTGSSDIYAGGMRRPWASVNFVTVHDGFTLHDLVSYDRKHNEPNGEDNRDGSSDNRSSNNGVEGPTTDPIVSAIRRRQKRNMLATLLLSRGTPMILGGDEFGRTQRGNNNAYCQDNETSWFDWADADELLTAFTRRLLELRRTYVALRRTTWLEDGTDARWFAPDGEPMMPNRWDDPDEVGLMLLLRGDPDLLLVLHEGADGAPYALPTGEWTLELATDDAMDARAGSATAEPAVVLVPGRTLLLLRGRAAVVG